MKAVSVNTNDAGRDEHLRSADFFGVEQNPELRFESTGITQIDEDTFEIVGELTMNGITKPIKLTRRSRAPRPTRGATSASASRSRASSTAATGT